MNKPSTKEIAIILTSVLVFSCAGQVSVPEASVLDRRSSSFGTLESLKPSLASNGMERLRIPGPNRKVKLPRKGDPFLYGLTVTEPLEAFYRSIDSKDKKKALDILDGIEKSEVDPLMRYAAALLRVRVLIPMGRSEEVERALVGLRQLELQVFGRDFESTALRGEMNLWRGNLEEARIHYEKVLLAIGRWRVPTFYMKPPSNNNEIIYYGRAQLTANIGLVGILIQKSDYESALAWAMEAENRFLDILGLTEHFLYGRYMKATPDLYTSHGWCLAFLAAARLGYSKNAGAGEELFQRAREYFTIEGHLEGDRVVDALREYVSIQTGLMEKPTFLIGVLPELPERDRSELLRTFEAQKEGHQDEKDIFLPPALPKPIVKGPRSGERQVFGFTANPEFEAAFKAYLQSDGDKALEVLDKIDLKTLDPSLAWALSFLRAQVLIMMGRAADAEVELERTEGWEQKAFGTNINARSLRGEARSWLGDHERAILDFLQVLRALDRWRLPTSYVFAPSDPSQLALRSRAQLRAFVGLAGAYIMKQDYVGAFQWAKKSEALFRDLYEVLEHPIYQHYVDLDSDMIYGRGINLGILGAARMVMTKDPDRGDAVLGRAKEYFDILGYPAGQVIVDTFQVRALLEMGEVDRAEALAKPTVKTAIEKGFVDFVWQIEALLGEALLRQERQEEAEGAFRRAQAAVRDVSGSLTTDRAKRRFGIGKELITRRLVERDIQKENWEDLFRDLEQGRAQAFVDLLSRQHAPGNREGQAVREIRELEKKIRRERLRNLAGLAGSGGRETEKNLVELRRQRLEALRARDPEITQTLSISTEGLAEIRRRLGEGEILFYALPAPPQEKIRLFVIDSKRASIETTDLSQEDLRNALKNFQSFNTTKEVSSQNEAARILTQQLHLKKGGVPALLYIVPSGELYFVPWGALDLDCPVIVLPTGGWLKRSPPSRTSTKTATVVGDPDTGGAFPPLPGAREEAQAVGRIYAVEALLGKGATEEALRSDLGRGVDVLHLATHGLFNDKDPLQSAVILSRANGGPYRLTAAGLFENPLPPAKLVVLSACETGLGQAVAGDDFLGLVRSFYLGGTLAVLYSLWPVPDLPTRFFMETFHRHAASGDYDQAWLKARRLMKEKGFSPSEYGAFILGGQKKG